MSSQSVEEVESYGVLGRHFDSLSGVRVQVADELDVQSLVVDGSLRSQMNVVSDFFRGKIEISKLVLRPDVLSIAVPLARKIDAGESPNAAVAGAVHRGVCLLSQHGIGDRKLARVLMFPFFLTVLTLAGLLFASHHVVAQFEDMFVSFGMILPPLTDALFSLSRFIRWYTVPIILVTTSILPIYLLLNWIDGFRNPASTGCWERWVSGKRMAVSRWLFHVSLLADLGLEVGDSMKLAGRSSGSGWLWRRSKKVATEGGKVFGGRRFATAQAGLEMPSSPGKVALLREVATWYRDRSANFFDWWLSLLVSAYCWFIMLLIFFTVISVMAPLIAIISGLTGV